MRKTHIIIAWVFMLAWAGAAMGQVGYIPSGRWGGHSDPGRFSNPNGVAVSSKGDIHVADSENHRIQVFDSKGALKAIWPVDPLTPRSLALDAAGNLYVILDGNTIRKYNPDGGVLTQWDSSCLDDDYQFVTFHGITVDAEGKVYVTGVMPSRVYKFTADGDFITEWGDMGSGDGQFHLPGDITVDNNGDILVLDNSICRVQKFSPDGDYLSQWGSYGWGEGKLDNPRGITMDASGRIYITDIRSIQRFSPDGVFQRQLGTSGRGPGRFVSRHKITVSTAGEVIVSDYSSFCVQALTTDGQFLRFIGVSPTDPGQLWGPAAVAPDTAGGFYVSERTNDRIQHFGSDDALQDYWGGTGTGAGEFTYPTGLALDSQDRVYVSEDGSKRIQRFSAEGEFQTQWGDETLDPSPVTNGGRLMAYDADDLFYKENAAEYPLQRFSADGDLLAAFKTTAGGEVGLNLVSGLARDSKGWIYAAITQGVMVMDDECSLLDIWGRDLLGVYREAEILDVAIDAADHIYIASRTWYLNSQTTSLDCVAKYSKDQVMLTLWRYPNQIGQIDTIAVDNQERVYMVDHSKDMIHRFSPDHTLQRYQLQVNVIGQGSVTRNPTGADYPAGSMAIVKATPAKGWVFTRWEGGLSSEQDMDFVYMDGHKIVTAVFTDPTPPVDYTLDVKLKGLGKVTLDPPGKVHQEETTVTLTATPGAYWKFDHWEGAVTGANNPSELLMDADKTVKAVFIRTDGRPGYALDYTIDGKGSMTLDPPGPYYDPGVKVNVKVTPAAGWRFVKWRGSLSGTTNPASVTMDWDKDVYAVLANDAADKSILNTSVQGKGTITSAPPGNIHTPGSTVSVQANPASGWSFDHWEGAITGDVNPQSLVMNSDKSVTAVFIQEAYGCPAPVKQSTKDDGGSGLPVLAVTPVILMAAYFARRRR